MHALEGPAALVERLAQATNAHDLDAVVACFSADYRNLTPAHPSRGFTGRDQVRRNWEQIFAFVPDVTAEVVSFTVDEDTVWSEWEHRGTRLDGSRHLMRGVVILGISGAEATWARFYLEPVDDDGSDVNASVRRQVTGAEPGSRS
jgi:ketosteroid isomerase-like protein